MTRSIRATLAVSAIALAVPGTALASRAHAPNVPATPPLAAVVSGFTAGTAAAGGSATGGTLTLALTGGGSVTAMVTPQTRFACPRVAPRRGAPPAPCDASQLVSGEGVVAAAITLTPAGIVFRSLELVPPSGPPAGAAT